MCLIGGVVVVDQFTLRLPQAIYLLTHWHADHYQGITKSSTSPIFCSKITRQLLLTKFPQLQSIVTALPLLAWTTLSREQEIEVFPFDSNHMAGSVMFLLRIQGKHHLHTGDTRFHPSIALNAPQLFGKNQEGLLSCRVEVEQMHLDNTFCDPIFKFPPRSNAIRMITNLVAELKPQKMFVCTDSVGKEEAFIALSRHFKTKVAVSPSRLSYIRAMDIPWQHYFTLDTQETWIQVISKGEREKRVAETKGAYAMSLTGWTNLDQPYPDGFNSYLIPYSLHSNFSQMEQLVSIVRPKKLRGIVRENRGWQKFNKSDSNFKGYMYSLYGIKQRGLQYLQKEYSSEKKQSTDRQQNDVND